MEDILSIGIDPGKNGAIVAVYKDTCNYIKMPFIDKEKTVIDAGKVMNFIEETSNMASNDNKDSIIFVTIEKQQSYPAQGLVSTFTTGFLYGQLIGILRLLKSVTGLPIIYVHPTQWRSAICPECKTKKDVIRKAVKMFSYLPEHDGVADAVMIAKWGIFAYITRNNDTKKN